MTTLFELIQDSAYIDDILLIYEDLRKPRAMEVRRRSSEELRTFSLPNGPEQRQRDYQLSQLAQSKDCPMSLMDPIFREWLRGYDAIDEAAQAWSRHLERRHLNGEVEIS